MIGSEESECYVSMSVHLNHLRTFSVVLYSLIVCLGAGCASAGYRKQTSKCINDYDGSASTDLAQETRARALEHSAYHFIPFQRNQMYWYDPRHVTWYFFGNDANGIFGEGATSEHPYSTNINCKTWVKWDVMRNLGHNVNFYPPLGSACFEKHWNWSLFKANAKGVALFAPDRTPAPSGTYSVRVNLNDLKPFLSVGLGRFDCYIGWRERGNFGASFRFHRKSSPPDRTSIELAADASAGLHSK